MSRNYELTPEMRKRLEGKRKQRKRQIRRRMLLGSIFCVIVLAGISLYINSLYLRFL